MSLRSSRTAAAIPAGWSQQPGAFGLEAVPGYLSFHFPGHAAGSRKCPQKGRSREQLPRLAWMLASVTAQGAGSAAPFMGPKPTSSSSSRGSEGGNSDPKGHPPSSGTKPSSSSSSGGGVQIDPIGHGLAPDVFKAGDLLHDSQYRLDGKLADGRFTTVWRATDMYTQQEVVLKVMEAGDVDSFTVGTREALSHSAAGRHPHLVTLLDAFEQRSPAGRHACTVMEVCGDNLASVSDRFGGGLRMGLPLPVVQSVARQVLEALQQLHSRRLMHRNVKIDNMLLDKPFLSMQQVAPWEVLWHQLQEMGRRFRSQQQQQGPLVFQRPGCYSEADLETARVKLGDFGRCLPLDRKEDPMYDEGGIIWGVPGYRPPEEVLALEHRTTAYDLWQLGCSCYCLATGQELFLPSPGESYDINDKHLGEMKGVLGRIPRQWAAGSPVYRRYFTPSGRLALEMEYQVASEPLERILVEEHGMEADEAAGLAGFLRSLLTYNPEERPSAACMLQHPWLTQPLTAPDEDPEARALIRPNHQQQQGQ